MPKPPRKSQWHSFMERAEFKLDRRAQHPSRNGYLEPDGCWVHTSSTRVFLYKKGDTKGLATLDAADLIMKAWGFDRLSPAPTELFQQESVIYKPDERTSARLGRESPVRTFYFSEPVDGEIWVCTRGLLESYKQVFQTMF